MLRQIEIAKELLIKTGGAGIAANQCAAILNPYQFTIVGVYKNNAEHTANLNKRYPGITFPEAALMINPKIIRSSSRIQFFKHGCLSVPGCLRGDMPSPETIGVEFLTLIDDQLTTEIKLYQGVDAVVLHHEINHILHGKTYIDVCLEGLSSHERVTLIEKVESELLQRQSITEFVANDCANQSFHRFIYKNELDQLRLDVDAFNHALTSLDTKLLVGLLDRISCCHILHAQHI